MQETVCTAYPILTLCHSSKAARLVWFPARHATDPGMVLIY